MRALIVDDSDTARAMAASVLEEVGFDAGVELDIAVASGGVEALKVLAAGPIHILLVDLHMPDIHGLEVVSFWKQRPENAAGRALMISTEVSAHDRDKALAVGAAGFLEKPITAGPLQDALSDLLGGAP